MQRAARSPGQIAVVAGVTAALLAASAFAQTAAPARKPGWWQLASRLPNGSTLTRYLCLDAATDAAHTIFNARPGCLPTVRKVTGGYSFTKSCDGADTTGTAVGDFSVAYTITESRGPAKLTTAARWMGPCPADRKPGDVLMPNGAVRRLR
ncbi:MAG: DUF3617 family protein [Casimicrobiaceae bacterium]